MEGIFERFNSILIPEQLEQMENQSSNFPIHLFWLTLLQGHNYPDNPAIGVFMMILWCILLAPMFSYVRIKSNSVIAAAIMHGSLNATARLAIMVIKGGNDLLVGVTGLAGFIVLVFMNICLIIYNKFINKKPIVMEEQI